MLRKTNLENFLMRLEATSYEWQGAIKLLMDLEMHSNALTDHFLSVCLRQNGKMVLSFFQKWKFQTWLHPQKVLLDHVWLIYPCCINPLEKDWYAKANMVEICAQKHMLGFDKWLLPFCQNYDWFHLVSPTLVSRYDYVIWSENLKL